MSAWRIGYIEGDQQSSFTPIGETYGTRDAALAALPDAVHNFIALQIKRMRKDGYSIARHGDDLLLLELIPALGESRLTRFVAIEVLQDVPGQRRV